MTLGKKLPHQKWDWVLRICAKTELVCAVNWFIRIGFLKFFENNTALKKYIGILTDFCNDPGIYITHTHMRLETS